MYKVYALKNPLQEIYVGYTENLALRLERHNNRYADNKTGYTSKHRGPWEVFYQEECADKKSAMVREKQLKSFRGREFLRTLL